MRLLAPQHQDVRRAQWRGAALTFAWLFPLLWCLAWGVMAVTP